MTSFTISCPHFNQLQTLDLYKILELRCAVFMIEQNCKETELDWKDLQCYHLCFYDGDTLAAYARLLPPGLSYTEMSIGRVVVAPAYRNTGVGKQLMDTSIDECYKLFGNGAIKISGQLYLERFYNNLGFETISEVYDEAGIPHIKMLKPYF
jgi:ElaA protein